MASILKKIAFGVIVIVFLLLLLRVFSFWMPLSYGEKDLVITSHIGFLDKNGYYNVYGEIENKGNKNYSDIKLRYTFYDSSGNILYTEEGEGTKISLHILLSGRRSPFSYILINETLASLVKNYTIHISSKKVLDKLVPAKLQITYHKPEGNSILVVIINSGDLPANFTTLYATFYDMNKSVIGIDSLLSSIKPGKSSFIIEISKLGKKFNYTDVGYYSLTAESLNPEYVIQEEISYAYFMQENPFPDPVITIFAIVILFSATMLISIYLILRFRQGKKRRHIKKSIKKNLYENFMLENRK